MLRYNSVLCDPNSGCGCRPASFVVSNTCRDHLAKTRGFRPCHLMDANRERPACEVREQSDTRVLLSVASISGMIQVCTKCSGV